MRFGLAAVTAAAAFAMVATAMLPVAAEENGQRAASDPVSHDVRRAAEELSAKFAGGASQGSDSEAPAIQASPAYRAPTDPKNALQGSNPNAIGPDATGSDPKGPRSEARPLITGSLPDATPHAAGHSGRSSARVSAERVVELRRPRAATSWEPVPGASTGWQTGVIGLFTNPAFWH